MEAPAIVKLGQACAAILANQQMFFNLTEFRLFEHADAVFPQ